ncbi:MAG: YigZ family protein [Cyclobacteriaceae bacterium]|nr:YigZ family protein [Cyclobacteriaceae bacterium]
MIDHFFTIGTNGTGLYKEKGSKFLAFSFPVDSVEQANNRLDELRKKYHDARHHCYAYILGEDGLQIRANDDGEPNHSAGDPILGQLKSANLTNTLVVVVRYFGGTKLGVSGLIHAYKTAAEEAINNSNKTKQFITTPIRISYGYNSTNEVMKLIDVFNLEIKHQEFLERCTLEASIIVSKNKQLQKDLQLLIDTGNDIIILKE